MAADSNKFLHRVAAHLLQRFGTGLGEVAIVFNNKRPSLFMREYLAEISGRPLWSPHFLTIQQFFTEVSGVAAASQIRQFFVLFESYTARLQEEGLERISAADFYPLAEILLSDFAQVDYYLADPDRLFSLMGEYAGLQQQFPNFDEEQLAFLESFWASFSADKQNAVQERFVALWKRMPGLYRDFKERLTLHNAGTQAGIYRQAAEDLSDIPARFTHVAFVGFNALSRAEEKLFRYWQDQGRASFYFDADEHYLEDERQEAGYFIRRNIRTVGLINALPGLGNRVNDPAREIRVIRAIGNVAQGKLLQELGYTRQGDSRQAIVLADEGLLLPVLQTVGGDHLNVTMGYPFRQSLTYGLCELWLSVQEELLQGTAVPYRLVLDWLFNPLIGPGDAERDSLYDEIIQKRMTVVGNEVLWPMGPAASSLFLPSARGPAVVSQLKELLGIAALSPNLRWLEKRLIAEALKSLTVLGDNLGLIAAGNDDELRPAFVFRMVRRAFEGLSVPFEGEPLSGLQVMGLLESRCLDFDEIVFLGMNEGVLPKISTSPTFIPDNLRRAFGLPVLENQNAIFAYFFYRLLHCAKKVTLVYNGITDEQSSGEASRFIEQLKFETSCRFDLQQQYYQPAGSQVDKRIIVEKDGPVWNKLQRFFSSKGEAYEEKLSASSFTDYVSCPLKFFFSRIAQLREPDDLPDQLEARLVGNMLHELMEKVYEGTAGRVISTEFLAARQRELPRLALSSLIAVLQKNTGAVVFKPSALQQIVLEVLVKYARNILEYDAALTPFTIRELENKSDYKVQVEVKVGKHRQKVWLYGIIDRVDEHNGRTRIVDYKTGRDKIEFRDLDSLFDENGKHQNKALLQTLFYTLVFEKAKGVSGVEPHLYTVRSFKERTLFRDRNRVALQDEALDSCKAGFYEKMIEKLEELFNPAVPFRQTANLETCKYCRFREICRR